MGPVGLTAGGKGLGRGDSLGSVRPGVWRRVVLGLLEAPTQREFSALNSEKVYRWSRTHPLIKLVTLLVYGRERDRPWVKD